MKKSIIKKFNQWKINITKNIFNSLVIKIQSNISFCIYESIFKIDELYKYTLFENKFEEIIESIENMFENNKISIQEKKTNYYVYIIELIIVTTFINYLGYVYVLEIFVFVFIYFCI